MLNKKYLLVVLIVIILGFLGGAIFFVVKNSEVAEVIPTVTPTPPEEELATYEDQSEFSFQYPKSLNLNPHDEDRENYAHVELTSPSHAGNIILWTKDTTSTSLENWVKDNKVAGSLDSTLGEEIAKKVLINEGGQKITLTTIRNGYLYQIEASLTDFDFWNKIFEIVSSTYKFVPGQNAQEDTATSQVKPEQEFEEDVIFEGEEVIE